MSNYGTDEENGGVYRVENIMARVFDPITGRLLVSSKEDVKYSNYESNTVNPGSSANGYDVKTTGGLFVTVVTSYRTIIKNNSELSPITLYLNTDNTNPITLKANGELDIEGYPVTNIFIDTDVDFSSSTVEVTLFG